MNTTEVLSPSVLAQIKLIALDVDGVLTQGDISYTSAGDEIKTFNAKDGLGISLALRNDIPIALITARQSNIVERRAQELGIPHVRQNAKNKLQALEALLIELNIAKEHVAYMGDDLPDIPALQVVALACCPADAVDAVKESCNWIAAKDGGKGAVRELIDQILSSRATVS